MSWNRSTSRSTCTTGSRADRRRRARGGSCHGPRLRRARTAVPLRDVSAGRRPARGARVNMRPAGGLSVDMMNFANDFDFFQEWANVVVHGRFEARVTRPYACLYVMRRDGRPYALSHAQVMRRVRRAGHPRVAHGPHVCSRPWAITPTCCAARARRRSSRPRNASRHCARTRGWPTCATIAT